ncbi:MAG: FkbM family methyltransferase [Ruminococcaceae bacterium]|nr:FkbM family methyltransferase [Oscillospiraceae bacterium]
MISEILKKTSSWEMLKSTELPVILYGTGNGADRVIDEFLRLGITLSGITASDGFVRKRQFRGFEVKEISYFEELYGDFAVAVAFGSNLDSVIKTILGVAEKHRTVVPCVPVYGDTVFNREFIEKNKIKLEQVYGLLADDISKEVFSDVVKFELTGELKYLLRSETSKDEAFGSILKLGADEHCLDIGAYRGDTVDEFLKYTGGLYGSITALEPDAKSFEKLRAHTSNLKNCRLVNKGIWSECTEILFSDGKKGRGNSASQKGKPVKTVTVDLLDGADKFTYIKADAEGCEGEMLYGAYNTLKKKKPKLNIACYHRSEDIFELPLKIREINPDYRIYLRHHHYIPCWDMNLYCV